jgi:hypothetical protein
MGLFLFARKDTVTADLACDAMMGEIEDSPSCDSYAAALGTIQEAYCILRQRMEAEYAADMISDMVEDIACFEIAYQLREARAQNRIC